MSEKATIRAFANGGEAVGTLESGKTVFVRGAIPGEVVEVEIFQDKNRYSKGRLLNIIEESSERIASFCPEFPRCPGCSYCHVPYRIELEWKQKQLEYLLRDFEGIVYNSPVGAPGRTHWRNKLTLHIENSRCGYRSDDNTTLVPVTSCAIAAEPINEKIASLDLRQEKSVILRYTPQEGVAVFDREKGCRKIITEHLREAGVFKVAADGFFQTNPEIADKLLSYVVSEVQAANCRELCELYCGVGVFSIACAGKIPELRCTGVEISKDSVIRCRNNAANHNVSERCRFHAGDAGTLFSRYKPQNSDFLLLVDPPRTGMDKNMINCIKRHHPAQLIYISCAADTLARDLRNLASDYTIDRVTLFDMFPSTAHFETVTVLKRIAAE